MKDYTKGPILKALITLSLPIIFANIFSTVYQLTDTFWVGRLGEKAVAAVSLTFPISFFVGSLTIGLASAGSILIAQFKGKKDQKSIDYTSAQTLSLLFIAATCVAVFGYLLSKTFIGLMSPDPSVAIEATKYLQITFLGFSFFALFFGYQSVMRGVGEVKMPMYIIIFTVFLNFILDPLFILGWGPIPAFGVSGAAVATIGTESLASLMGLYILFKGHKGIKIKLKQLKPDFKELKLLAKIGFPTSIEMSARSFSMVIMTFLAAVFGTTAIASYGMGGRILSFVIIPALGIAFGTATLVGQNIGADKFDRALKTTYTAFKVGFFFLLSIGILTFLFAEPIVAAFVPGETVLIKESAKFLKIMAFGFPFIGLHMGLIGLFRGSGNTRLAMEITIIFATIMVGSAYVLSTFTSLGVDGIYWAYPIANVIGTAIGFAYFFKSKWREKRIIS
ncbi:MATE family efflux transporter [Patescibacteria group bacterium]